MQVHQLDTTNILLGVLVAVSALELLGMLIISVWLMHAVRETRQTLATFEMQRLAPLQAEVLAITHQIRSIVGHAESVAAGIERNARHLSGTIESVNGRVEGLVDRSLDEVTALGTGVTRAFRVFLGSREKFEVQKLKVESTSGSSL